MAATSPSRAPAEPTTVDEDRYALSDGDRRMRRLLRLSPEVDPAESEAARNAMTTSLVLSGLRCLVLYLVLPFVAPAVVRASGVTGAIGLAVNVIAVVSLTVSVRRFFRAHDPRRWQYTAFAGVVAVFLAGFFVVDIANLVG